MCLDRPDLEGKEGPKVHISLPDWALAVPREEFVKEQADPSLLEMLANVLFGVELNILQ